MPKNFRRNLTNLAQKLGISAEKALFLAARDKKLAQFKLYLSIATDVNHEELGANSLWWIVRHYAGTRAGGILVQKLISLGANTNNLAAGNSALELAAHAGDVTIAQHLLAAHAAVTPRALALAVSADKLEMVQTLIAAKVTVLTRIILTVIKSERVNIEIIKLLIDNCSDINATPTPITEHGVTSLLCAATEIKIDVVRDQVIDLLILAGIAIDTPYSSTDSRTALYIAAQNGDFRHMNYYIQGGADVNIVHHGTNLLWELANHWRKIIDQAWDWDENVTAKFKICLYLANVLIERKLDVNMDTATTYLDTPLLLATQSIKSALAELLVKNGANVNVTSIERPGATPLWFALYRRKAELALLLLEYNAKDVDTISSGQAIHNRGIKFTFLATPLALAAELGDEAVLSKLLARHAYPGKTGCLSPLLQAIKYSSATIVALLLNDLSTRDTAVSDFYFADELLKEAALLTESCVRGYDILKVLITHGVDINGKATLFDIETNKPKDVPFVEWVFHKFDIASYPVLTGTLQHLEEILALLLEKGLNPNTIIGHRSLLSCAIRNQLPSVIRLLALHGADTSAFMQDTSVDIAVRYKLYLELMSRAGDDVRHLKTLGKGVTFLEEPGRPLQITSKFLEFIPPIPPSDAPYTPEEIAKHVNAARNAYAASQQLKEPREQQREYGELRQQQERAKMHAAKVIYSNILKHADVSKLPDAERARFFVASFLPVFQRDINLGVASNKKLRELLYARVATMPLFSDENDARLIKDRFAELFKQAREDLENIKRNARPSSNFP